MDLNEERSDISIKSQYRKQLSVGLICLFMFVLSASTVIAFGKGSHGPDVYVVQGMLKSLGYYSNEMDGKYGKGLLSGVKQFQAKKGIPITGNMDNHTLQALLWAYAELKTKSSPPSKASPLPLSPSPLATSTPLAIDKVQLTAAEKLMIELVNQERSKQGLATLSVDLQLTAIARLKSEDLIVNEYFAHESVKYGSPFDMLKKFGVRYQIAGENLACNQTTELAHAALMKSPGHRENILKPSYTSIGIGIIEGGPCGTMYTQLFLGINE
jgi:uncharacterized YkwD family protein